MKPRFYTLLIGMTCLLGACNSGYHGNRHAGKDHSSSQSAKNLPDASLKDTQYAFAVENLKQDKEKVTFTIPKNAHSEQKKSDSVELSGMYTGSKDSSRLCPVVDSHYVSKKVDSYNPMSGRAEVTATFKDPALATRAIKSGCILVRDIG